MYPNPASLFFIFFFFFRFENSRTDLGNPTLRSARSRYPIPQRRANNAAADPADPSANVSICSENKKKKRKREKGTLRKKKQNSPHDCSLIQSMMDTEMTDPGAHYIWGTTIQVDKAVMHMQRFFNDFTLEGEDSPFYVQRIQEVLTLFFFLLFFFVLPLCAPSYPHLTVSLFLQ
jgi:hypothetical protein